MGKQWEIGDIIVFKDTSGKHACKRIVGLEGDQIDRLGEFVHLYQHEPDLGIRHVPFDFGDWESHLDKTCMANGKEKVVVPNGMIWVEGDNPLHSIDSRHYGLLSTNSILGIVAYRIWPRRRRRTAHQDDQGDVSCIMNGRNRRPHPLTEDEMFSGPYNIVKIPYTK